MKSKPLLNERRLQYLYALLTLRGLDDTNVGGYDQKKEDDYLGCLDFVQKVSSR